MKTSQIRKQIESLLTISSSIAVSKDTASALRLGERAGSCDSRSNRMSLVLELKVFAEKQKKKNISNNSSSLHKHQFLGLSELVVQQQM